MDTTVTLIGATGLIGNHLLELIKADDSFKKIKVLVRRPVTMEHPKLEVVQIDFGDLEAYRKAIEGSDAVFCSIGTTQHKVKGDKEAYRKVDFDIPLHAAKFCAESGCRQFLLVSAVGANSSSNNFYIKLKGEVEDEVTNQHIPSIHIFRPSMLLGHRAQEYRLAERIIQPLMKILSPVIPSKYKAIKAEDVAKAMVKASKQNAQGLKVYEYKEMMQ